LEKRSRIIFQLCGALVPEQNQSLSLIQVQFEHLVTKHKIEFEAWSETAKPFQAA